MGDSYRPQQRERERPPPPLVDRMTFTNGGGDSYRPGGSLPQQQQRADSRQFTFESAHSAPRFPPAGPANAGSRGPPTAPRRRARDGPSQRDGRRAGRPDHRGRNNANGFRRGGFRKAAPHERALLQQRDDGIEQTMGVADGPNRFKDLADLSDDSETDMDVSDESADEDPASDGLSGNRSKVARTGAPSRPDGDAVPKWSNPDPYTVLPPPEETTGKRIDFVNLIRKAKNVEAEKTASNNAVAANDDFISFGDDIQASETSELGVLGADVASSRPMHHAARERPMRGSVQNVDLDYAEDTVQQASHNSHLRFDEDSRHLARPNKHKRKQFDDDDGPPVDSEWLPLPGRSSTPWLLTPAPYVHLAKTPERWLHNEILDFYDFVAPQPFEHELRNNLVNRVNNALGPRRFPQDSGRILCFGSFPAGLYLPTADMDLVYTSDRHYNGGPPVLDFSRKGQHKSLLYKTSRKLSEVGMCQRPPTVIATAKVPLIKFVDSYTRLQVDVSFENLSGVQAQATFAQWKNQYPDMIYLVALLKQFLVMHGLNEVHTGGIGGFSIICLVVSYIHHASKPDNLGACFIGFLDYYGNKFDLATQRIQMNPPDIVKKTKYGIDDREERPDGLSIQDPNRPENNISGGSHKAKDAFKAFAAAHKSLQDRINAARGGQDIGPSILDCVLGGNYSSYIAQRNYMKSLK